MSIGEKIKVTPTELKEIIQRRLGFAAHLSVHRDAQLGFTVGIITAPSEAISAQQAVDAISTDLRKIYELVEVKVHGPLPGR